MLTEEQADTLAKLASDMAEARVQHATRPYSIFKGNIPHFKDIIKRDKADNALSDYIRYLTETK